MLIFIHDGHLFEFLFQKLGICYFLKLSLTIFLEALSLTLLALLKEKKMSSVQKEEKKEQKHKTTTPKSFSIFAGVV